MLCTRFFKIGTLAASSLLVLSAATSYTETRSFPPVTVLASETIQVNLANVAAASSSGTAASCAGSVAFYGSSGQIGSSTTFTLASNAVESIHTAGTGGAMLAVITLNRTSGTPCALESSLEVYSGANAPRLVLHGPGGPGGEPGPFRGAAFGR